jgi:hypothetical protein
MLAYINLFTSNSGLLESPYNYFQCQTLGLHTPLQMVVSSQILHRYRVEVRLHISLSYLMLMHQ